MPVANVSAKSTEYSAINARRKIRTLQAMVLVGLFACVLSIAAPSDAHATCPTFHTLANGTSADATQVMDNFNNILGCPNFTGNVGIGTASPATALDVAPGMAIRVGNANLSSGGDFAHLSTHTWYDGGGWHNDGSAGGLYQISGQNHVWYKHGGASNFVQMMMLASNGNLGIGVSPSYRLHVASTDSHTVFASAVNGWGALWGYNVTNSAQGLLGYGAWGVYCLSGSCGGTTTWTNNSDGRLKTRIRALPDSDGLAAIMRLRPVRFHWRDKDLDVQRGEQIGFIAQDAQKVFPEFIAKATSNVVVNLGDGKKEMVRDAKSMGYADLTAPLVKAVQELKAINDNQASQIAALKSQLKTQNAQLKAENDEFRRRLAALEQKKLHLAAWE
jgi:hypothetical protein